MSIQNAVGITFAATNISTGTAVVNVFDTRDYTYTGTSIVNQLVLGAVTITGVSTVNNVTTATYTLAQFPGVAFSGTVLANSASGILLQTTIAALGVSATNLYLSNTPQLAVGVVNLPNEAQAVVYVACYCRGTLIRTPDGLRPVEELAEGDLVSCVNGGTAAVRWVGTRSYGGRFLQANAQLRPVRFKAGSLAPSVPSRDLLVSPRHAMLIDGVLVPAELLVNGTTIVRDTGMATVEYFHVELPEHDAIWAEDATSESFVDDGSRCVFHNAHTYVALDAVAAEPVFCAPRVESGPVLDAIRARLNGAVELAAAA